MLSDSLKFLEKAFDVLNERFFESALPMPIITIQKSPGAYGHFTPWDAWDAGGQGRYEINIGAEYLNRPIVETLATLVHEMVHEYCCVTEIQDTSRSGVYHNKRFKAEAEKRGLIITKVASIGYSKTTPGPELEKLCKKNFAHEIALHRNGAVAKAVGKKKTSTRKYQCPDCETSVRATKQVNIICADCGKEFVLVEK